MSALVEEDVDIETLELHALDFEPDPECDYARIDCHNQVTWRATCRFSGCWALVCRIHMLETKRAQEWADHRRGGQRCQACGEQGLELLDFQPIISPEGGKLW